MLAVIRSDFEAIHGDLGKLQVEELVPVSGHPDIVVPNRKLKVSEQKGRLKFEAVIGEDVVELDVRRMPNGVDLVDTRWPAALPEYEEPL